MISIIFLAVLGLVVMTTELVGLRQKVNAVVLVGLLGALYCSIFLDSAGSFMNNMIVVDVMSKSMTRLLIFSTLIVSIMGRFYYEDQGEKIVDFNALMVFLLAGSVAMVHFGNMAMFFIGLEIMSVAAYILVTYKRKSPKANEAGLKYFILGAFMAGVLLMGIALLYGISGSFDLDGMAFAVSKSPNAIMVKLGVFMLMVGLMFKLALFPFQAWSPDVYHGSPMVITAFMSVVVKMAMAAVLYKWMMALMPALSWLMPIVAVVAVLSMVVGNASAYAQTNIKRIMAYSGIANAGTMALIMITIPSLTVQHALWFYALAYSISVLLIFSIFIMVSKATGKQNLSALKGMGRFHPLLGWILTLGLLSSAGIPPLAGFWAKYYVLIPLVLNHKWLALALIINAALGIMVYFKIMWAVWSTKNINDQYPILVPKSYNAIIIGLVLMLMVLGLMPRLADWLWWA